MTKGLVLNKFASNIVQRNGAIFFFAKLNNAAITEEADGKEHLRFDFNGKRIMDVASRSIWARELQIFAYGKCIFPHYHFASKRHFEKFKRSRVRSFFPGTKIVGRDRIRKIWKRCTFMYVLNYFTRCNNEILRKRNVTRGAPSFTFERNTQKIAFPQINPEKRLTTSSELESFRLRSSAHRRTVLVYFVCK